MAISTRPVLAIIMPCYNEQEIVEDSARAALHLLDSLAAAGKISAESFIYLINDGSTDKTWEKMTALHAGNPRIKALKLSRNFGHQNAILAGMSSVIDTVDCLITIDADLQDDINCAGSMIDLYAGGADVVYGIRQKRKSDTLFKRASALFFYRLMAFMGVSLVYNHSDFRLVSSKALHSLIQFKEVNLFLRGIFPLLGFKTATVHYDRSERTKGVTKFPFSKMFAFAMDGITSFSVTPLRLIMAFGFFVFIFSFVVSGWALWLSIKNISIPGWTSTLITLCIIGGMQLISTGVLGEYIAKIYMETKGRPRFLIDSELK